MGILYLKYPQIKLNFQNSFTSPFPSMSTLPALLSKLGQTQASHMTEGLLPSQAFVIISCKTCDKTNC